MNHQANDWVPHVPKQASYSDVDLPVARGGRMQPADGFVPDECRSLGVSYFDTRTPAQVLEFLLKLFEEVGIGPDSEDLLRREVLVAGDFLLIRGILTAISLTRDASKGAAGHASGGESDDEGGGAPAAAASGAPTSATQIRTARELKWVMGATIENMLKMIEVKLATDFPEENTEGPIASGPSAQALQMSAVARSLWLQQPLGFVRPEANPQFEGLPPRHLVLLGELPRVGLASAEVEYRASLAQLRGRASNVQRLQGLTGWLSRAHARGLLALQGAEASAAHLQSVLQRNERTFGTRLGHRRTETQMEMQRDAQAEATGLRLAVQGASRDLMLLNAKLAKAIADERESLQPRGEEQRAQAARRDAERATLRESLRAPSLQGAHIVSGLLHLFEMGVAGSILKIAWEAELAYLVKRCMESGDEQFRLYASTGPLGLLRFYAFLKRQCYWQALKLITTSEEMALQIMTGVTLGGFAVSPR
mmetsp:Transcript_42022/g.116054  ORF Transcript_42022/g.116054 Transcript_42022/m.116054 type:complete len:480 (+) Transcript_42022:350-1789(+)